MGERITPECDIFKTLQPKGLRMIHVKVWEDGQTPGAIDTVLVDATVAVGEPGKKRVLRIARNATKPYASTQQSTEAKVAGDA